MRLQQHQQSSGSDGAENTSASQRGLNFGRCFDICWAASFVISVIQLATLQLSVFLSEGVYMDRPYRRRHAAMLDSCYVLNADFFFLSASMELLRCVDRCVGVHVCSTSVITFFFFVCRFLLFCAASFSFGGREGDRSRSIQMDRERQLWLVAARWLFRPIALLTVAAFLFFYFLLLVWRKRRWRLFFFWHSHVCMRAPICRCYRGGRRSARGGRDGVARRLRVALPGANRVRSVDGYSCLCQPPPRSAPRVSPCIYTYTFTAFSAPPTSVFFFCFFFGLINWHFKIFLLRGTLKTSSCWFFIYFIFQFPAME